MTDPANDTPESHPADAETQFDHLSAEQMVRINRYCDTWERAWQQTKNKQIPSQTFVDFILQVPRADRQAAWTELVMIDVDYRRQRQMTLEASIYAAPGILVASNWLKALIDGPTKNTSFVSSEMEQPSSSLDSSKINLARSELKQLGDYQIVSVLGAGGMGKVYRAVHRLMGREVAIKVMREAHAEDVSAMRRFEREVRALAQLSHPNIVTAYDAREENGLIYLVTELIHGEDLARRVARKGPLKPRDAMYYTWQAAKGLHYAHQQGVIHRDIKPSNLILENKRTIKVLDLGLARLSGQAENQREPDPSLTQPDHVVGTARYMAPEQARSPLRADHRADVYSLGCTLFFLLTGSVPFSGETAIETIMAHWEQPIPDIPTAINQYEIPVGLRELVQQMMAKHPEQRPASMDEVIQRLDALLRMTLASSVTATDDSTLLTTTNVWPAATTSYGRNINQLASKSSHRYWFWGGIAATVASIVLLVTWWSFNKVWKPVSPPLDPALTNLSSQDSAQDVSLAPTSENQSNASVNATPITVNEELPIGNTREGLQFNGHSSYVAINDFDQEITGPFRIEVAAIAEPQSQSANLVTWANRQIAALFLLPSGQWGIAFLDRGQSRLIVTQRSFDYHQMYVVAGEWDGQGLRLSINGQVEPSENIQYNLRATAPALYFGGHPVGFYPEIQGTRFFAGRVLGVRISHGASLESLGPIATSVEQLRSINHQAQWTWPLTERRGDITYDLSARKWAGQLHNTVASPQD